MLDKTSLLYDKTVVIVWKRFLNISCDSEGFLKVWRVFNFSPKMANFQRNGNATAHNFGRF